MYISARMLLPQCFPQISSTFMSISYRQWYETNHTNQIVIKNHKVSYHLVL